MYISQLKHTTNLAQNIQTCIFTSISIYGGLVGTCCEGVLGNMLVKLLLCLQA